MRHYFSLRVLILSLTVIAVTAAISHPASAQPGSRPTPTPIPAPKETPAPTKTPTPPSRSSRPSGTDTNTVRNNSRGVPTLEQQLIGNWAGFQVPNTFYIFSPEGNGTLIWATRHDFLYHLKGDLLLIDGGPQKETYRIIFSGDDMKMTLLKDNREYDYWWTKTTGQQEVAIRFRVWFGDIQPPYRIIETRYKSGTHVGAVSILMKVEGYRKQLRIRPLGDTGPDYEVVKGTRWVFSPVAGTVVRNFVTLEQEIKADELLLIIRKN